MSNDVDRFLFAAGGKSARFENEGDMVVGKIVSSEVKQQTAIDEDNKPLFWPNGDPRMQLVIRLQTDERGDDDDGIRAIYAKGGDYEVDTGQGKSMKSAIADAVKKAGAPTLVEGDILKVAFTGMGKKTSRGFNAPKLYTAKYEVAPKATVSAEDLFD